MNLVDWPLQEAFEADPDGGGVTCVSWGTARYAPPMLAVGCFSGSLALWRHAAGSKWKVRYVTLHYITLYYTALHYITASRSGGTPRAPSGRYVTLHYITSQPRALAARPRGREWKVRSPVERTRRVRESGPLHHFASPLGK